jgi:hypothetical protein
MSSYGSPTPASNPGNAMSPKNNPMSIPAITQVV